MKNSNLFRKIAIGIAVIGVLTSIILAAVFPMKVATDTSSYVSSYTEDVFNFPLMIYVLSGTALLAISFYAASAHFKNQEETISELKSISSYLKKENTDQK